MNKHELNGKEYVSARELHSELGINKKFADWIKYSIERAYLEEVNDFITILGKSSGGRPSTEYYLTEHSAISIVVMSGGQNAKIVRDKVIKLFQKHETGEAFTSEQVIAMLDIAKLCTYISVQKYAEKQHYEMQNKRYDWWKYRANTLGYSVDEITLALAKINKAHKSLRNDLIRLEPAELIRISAMELLIVLGKSQEYARNAANLVKQMAKSTGIDFEIFDDTKEDKLGVFKAKTNQRAGLFSRITKALK